MFSMNKPVLDLTRATYMRKLTKSLMRLKNLSINVIDHKRPGNTLKSSFNTKIKSFNHY